MSDEEKKQQVVKRLREIADRVESADDTIIVLLTDDGKDQSGMYYGDMRRCFYLAAEAFKEMSKRS